MDNVVPDGCEFLGLVCVFQYNLRFQVRGRSRPFRTKLSQPAKEVDLGPERQWQYDALTDIGIITSQPANGEIRDDQIHGGKRHR
jgi:hypothetical protein